MPQNQDIYVDGVKLDPTDEQFFMAVDHIKYASTNITYITGKAGTGKTTLLKYMVQLLPNALVLAPTGIAAINAKGRTIHSFFQLSKSIYLPNDKRLVKENLKYDKAKIDIIKSMRYLIIDEVSMVRCDILDAIDTILRLYRGNSTPFGGIKVILFGDLFQLPAIPPKGAMADTFYQYYDSVFFFDSKVYSKSNQSHIELTKIHRQTEEEFINLLNAVRVNRLTKEQLHRFNQQCVGEPIENSIMLAPTNRIVDEYNTEAYNRLNTCEKVFEAEVDGDFPSEHFPAEEYLHLKEGAQVMLLANKYNGDGSFMYCNGDIGVIEAFEENAVKISLGDKTITVGYHTWDNIDYTYNKETKMIESNVVGTFCQLPIKLAWAITIHKSQGLTFDNVFANLNSAFSAGQVYVALSRCRRLRGLRMPSDLRPQSIIVDNNVMTFARQQTPDTLLIEQIKSGKADAVYKECRDAVDVGDVHTIFQKYKEAIKLRDDFGTPLFVKYIGVKIRQIAHLKHYKGIIASYRNRVLAMRKELVDKVNAIEELNEKLSKLEKEQSSVVLLLAEKTQEIQQAKRELSKLTSENKKLSTQNTILSSNVSEKQRQILFMEEKLRCANNEINRLQNISWFQKLLGHK